MLKVGTRVQIVEPNGAQGSKIGDRGTIVGLWSEGYNIRFDADYLRAKHGEEAGLFYSRVTELKETVNQLVLKPRRKLSP